MNTIRTKIGTLTIGQAPRSDIAPLIDAVLPEGVVCRHAGVLDGLSDEQIAEQFSPKPNEGLLTSKLLDGRAVVMGKSAVRAALEKKIAMLEEDGCSIIVLLCTGEFDGLKTGKARLIEPDHVIPPVVEALAGPCTLGVMVPLAEQAQSEARKWLGTKMKLVFSSASPYTATEKEVKKAATALSEQGADFVVLDCMGYRLQHKAWCREVIEQPVIASTDLMVNLLRSML